MDALPDVGRDRALAIEQQPRLEQRKGDQHRQTDRHEQEEDAAPCL
jgi:hypothetical protein